MWCMGISMHVVGLLLRIFPYTCKCMSVPGTAFDVTVADTAQSVRCEASGKPFKLHVQNEGLFLQSPDGPVANHWPLR